MKVSVITACYNSARTLGETIDSVASQTYGDIEHVVVDGGSTDGTMDLIARHRGSIAKLVAGPDKGIYDALNKGVAASTGDMIAFLHSDDVYAGNDVIERLAREIQSHSLDVIYGDVAFFRTENPERTVRLYSSKRFRPSRIGWGWMPAHPALVVSKRIFRSFGLFKTDYKIAADFEFVARIFARPNFQYRYLPRVLVRMRMGGASTQGWRSTLTINREVLRACRENGISTNYLKILSKYPAKALEFFMPAA
jgi:glycosyltransferase involved in cell wall biosynthesis